MIEAAGSTLPGKHRQRRALSSLPEVVCNSLAAVQGSILDMMRDCNTGIRWILNHTHFHGGDPSQVYLVGQSCGAQLAAITMITQVMSCLHICQNMIVTKCALKGYKVIL